MALRALHGRSERSYLYLRYIGTRPYFSSDGGGDAEGEADDADEEGGGPQAAARGSVAVTSMTPVQI